MPPVSVDCSAGNTTGNDLHEIIERLLRASGLPPGRLVLEITETALIEEPSRSLQVLREIASLGVLPSIDDFGTAYSSLDHLRRLPAREPKIDRSFVEGVGGDEARGYVIARPMPGTVVSAWGARRRIALAQAASTRR